MATAKPLSVVVDMDDGQETVGGVVPVRRVSLKEQVARLPEVSVAVATMVYIPVCMYVYDGIHVCIYVYGVLII